MKDSNPRLENSQFLKTPQLHRKIFQLLGSNQADQPPPENISTPPKKIATPSEKMSTLPEKMSMLSP